MLNLVPTLVSMYLLVLYTFWACVCGSEEPRKKRSNLSASEVVEYEFDIFESCDDKMTGSDFWLKRREQMPTLFCCYRNLLSARPTNAEVERMFSASNLVQF